MIQQTINWCRPDEIELTRYEFYDILVDARRQWGADKGEVVRAPCAQFVKDMFIDYGEEIPLSNILAISVIRYPSMQELKKEVTDE
jgi:hypothetical protein